MLTRRPLGSPRPNLTKDELERINRKADKILSAKSED
jgi:hypothetical protein